jgi:uncharacterized protein YkwD
MHGRMHRHLVHFAVATGLPLMAAMLLSACQSARGTPPSHAAAGAEVALPGAGASHYVTAVPPGSALDDPNGALARAFAAAQRARGVSLRGDPRLASLSRFVAEHVSPEGAMPEQAALDAVARHLGLVEPTPHFLIVSADARDDLSARVQPDLESMLAAQAYSHFGGVVAARGGSNLCVAALSFRFVQLAPVPRHLDPGAPLEISGQLAPGYSDPKLAVTRPDGSVARGEPVRGANLHFSVETGTRGIYRVEVLGHGPQGITVIANFPVYVGDAPPTTIALGAGSDAAVSAERAAAMLLEMMNAERAKVQLPPLALDAALTRVAEAHTADMIEHGFIAHDSPTTGNAEDRVARAGIHSSVVLENIGRGYSPREVHDGLMASPGHRGNILSDAVNRVGIGVSATREPSQTDYLVTEVFTLLTPKLTSDAAEQLLARINAERERRKLQPLTADGTLRSLATRAAVSFFAQPPPSERALLEQLQGELQHTQLELRGVTMGLMVTGDLNEVSRRELLRAPATRRIGIGVAQGSRPDKPDNALCVVLLLAE